MGDKQKLLHEADEAYEELGKAIAGLDEAKAGRVFLGTWGTREILIHIAAWNREMAPALTRIGKGEPPYADGFYDDADAWNARFVEAKKGEKLSEILADVERSHRDLVSAAAALSDQHLGPDTPARGMLEATAAQHYREHAAQIREWRSGEER